MLAFASKIICEYINSRYCFSTQNKKALRQKSKAFLWSGRRDSNSQQPAWKAGTLAIELLPHTTNII